MNKKTSLPNNFSFSEAMDELEVITAKLESGEVKLDEAVTLFERGNVLAEYTKLYLTTVKNTIQTVQVAKK